ncbi:MAG: bifunctional (p)ppGpp synthetase/guanosine-3',5'-bis(diphosphate) 3'-pyrophosphohydrolase [Chitinophagaceae bacterium]|nr:MAG: bifunctional (p)ppGpp synthetase/guanosine-3',5'-bis(diphosphate) 3'-pyrophosphohydrolase [Chitinophagaceae bacterium]
MGIETQSELVKRAAEFAAEAHRSVNHTYDGQPYEVHLRAVSEAAERHSGLLPDELREAALAAAWLHDTIEDCRLTYNDIRKEFGEQVAELVYALTNEKGRTRKERANDKYYEGIRNTPGAVYVKLCDRIANVGHSRRSGQGMLNVYRGEHDAFIQHLGVDRSNPLVQELDALFANEPNPGGK